MHSSHFAQGAHPYRGRANDLLLVYETIVFSFGWAVPDFHLTTTLQICQGNEGEDAIGPKADRKLCPGNGDKAAISPE